MLFVSLFSYSLEYSESGEFCIYNNLPDVQLMNFSLADGDHNLTMKVVVQDSAGDSSWVGMHAYKAYSEYHIRSWLFL